MTALPTDVLELAALMSRRIDGSLGYLGTYDRYFAGQQPTAFVSPESAAALGGRLPLLNVNLARLAVLSLAERMRITGFRLDGTTEPDAGVWNSWTRSGFDLGADTVHVDAFVGGRSYVVAWVDDQYGDPLLSAESAAYCTTIEDPATRRVLAAMKRWMVRPDPDQQSGTAFQVIFTPDRVVTLASKDDVPVSAYPPPGAFRVVESLPNPTGWVPVTCFRNGYGRRIVDAPEGESELSDLMPLIDGIAKLAQDQQVTSEVAARPRRWATGLELIPRRDPDTGEEVTDEDGAPIYEQPFDSDVDRVWQSESPETAFGQFPQADLSPYSGAISTLIGMAGAVSTLPAHYLGVFTANPPSADAIRSAEASLTSRALGKVRMMSPAWARVAALEVALRTGRDPASVRADPVFASAETRTPSQDADEAAKLGALGVPLAVILREVLGWTPDQVNAMRQARLTDAIDAAAVAPIGTPPPVAVPGA